ncbi:hypothetical protein BDW74DRAFT_189130 [Aspergillus multicolor]|uniref:cytochrome P450 n=1 Tax=Aspergillus multicolor TaxID=41759 RepID=UPI003CCDBFB3
MLLLMTFLTTAGWTVYNLVCLTINARRAQKIGIPYHIIPFSPINPLWGLLEPGVFFILDRLPFQLSPFNHYGRRSWQIADKAESHRRMGEAFAIATPREVFVFVCDADAISDVLARRLDFVRPTGLYGTLRSIFNTVQLKTAGAKWKRHRKVLATLFNERTNGLVWRETISQARQILARNISKPFGGAKGVMRTVSLNVLYTTAFGRPMPSKHDSNPQSGDSGSGSDIDPLHTVLLNTLLIMLIPASILRLPFLPPLCRKVGKAVEDFRDQMVRMLNNEQALLEQGKPESGTLMSSLVRESRFAVDEHGVDVALTPDEILGNLYVVTFAGHDTTASTLAYILHLLAAFPDVQEWVGEEIRSVCPNPDPSTWELEYKDAFPRLKRCLAVVLETLRLYPPIPALPKSAAHETGTTLYLPETKRTLHLPKGTMVVPSILATQVHPKYWPDDPNVWKPTRWIELNNPTKQNSSRNDGIPEARLATEELIQPYPGTYLPWSAGVQYCPGRKFAQVEIVAVVAALLRGHRLRVEMQDGESFEEARARVLRRVNDGYQVLVLQMRDADGTRFFLERIE